MAEETSTAIAPKKPEKPAESGYWRNVSKVQQIIFSPDETQKIVPPEVLIHEDQFTDPKALPRFQRAGLFIKVPDVAIAKQEKKNNKLIIGGKYNTAVGHYIPPAAEKAA